MNKYFFRFSFYFFMVVQWDDLAGGAQADGVVVRHGGELF